KRVGTMIIGLESSLGYKLIKVCSRPGMNRKGSTGKLIKRWPILVDHYSQLFLYSQLLVFNGDFTKADIEYLS
uniref:hypothetical protein n=1 Tax=uncultured Vibrio sp. TaxID=114054 RepID=UPI002626B81A